MYGRHIAVDECFSLFSVVCNGMDVYLLGFMVPVCLGLQGTHASMLEFEVIDAEVGVGSKASEERRDCSETCGLAAELYGMEVH